jgi:hypothetical protein
MAKFGARIVLLSSLTACTPNHPPIASLAPVPSLSPTPKPSVSPKTTPSALPSPSKSPSVTGYPVVDELKKIQFTTESKNIFKNGKLPISEVTLNPTDLLTVLKNTRRYFQEQKQFDPDIARDGILGAQGVTVKDILHTLDFTIATLEEDIAKKQPIRLQDAKFINDNFRVLKWQPFNPHSQKQRQLRMTKYAVFSHPGSRQRTPKFNIGLYALKNNSDADRLRLKYTKQDVLTGIYEPGGKEFGQVEPLVYLDRVGLESALMEGTVRIDFEDGKSAFFNVDRNNNIPYVKKLKPTEQKRYWYFKPVDEIKGYGHSIETKISIKPGVTFAGDVLNIGLGRMVVTEHTNKDGKPQLRMGVIADTGGAFLPNLYQLDFLAGVFNSHEDYSQFVQNLPEYVRAYILVKK